MTFNELVTKVRGMSDKIDISGTNFLAVQVNITGENSGVFYVEVKNGKISVEPYDYHDRSCGITISMDNFNKLIDGKLVARKREYQGWVAEIIQHMIDHCNGKLV